MAAATATAIARAMTTPLEALPEYRGRRVISPPPLGAASPDDDSAESGILELHPGALVVRPPAKTLTTLTAPLVEVGHSRDAKAGEVRPTLVNRLSSLSRPQALTLFALAVVGFVAGYLGMR